MIPGPVVDGVLVQWGERLFYPPNRVVRPSTTPRLDTMTRRKAAVIHHRIAATVARRAPQVMVKVTGGGRGMAAIAAHFRYISKNGQLVVEDDRGARSQGKEALHDLVEQWRHGGSLIEETSERREAFNIMLSMPHGTDARAVMKAAAEFARIELHGHRYVMVLHEHQANPHVHLSVRAESRSGERLYPRKADLHRWRETFAERLRGWGVEAEATRQATRGATRNFDPIWRLKARQDGRLREVGARVKTGLHFQHSRNKAIEAWAQIKLALQQSEEPDDRALAERIGRFVLDTDYGKRLVAGRPRSASTPDRTRDRASLERILTPTRRDPEIER